MAKKTEPFLSASSMAAMVEKDELKHVYLFYGPEEYLKSYFSGRLIKRIGVGRESVKRLEGKITGAELDDALGSSFLFADTTVVLVRNSGLFKGTGKGQTEAFGFLKDLDGESFVIFSETEADKTNSLFKLAESCGAVFDCCMRSLPEVTGSLTKRAGMNGVSITPGAIKLLYEGIGKDLFGLYNEVDRLALLVPGGLIDERLVLDESPLSIEAKIYDFTDAVVEKKYDKAMNCLEVMQRDKIPAQYILVSLSKHFQSLYDVYCLESMKMTPAEITEKLGLRDFVTKKYIRQCESYNRASLAAMLDMIADLDLNSKNGSLTTERAVELIIAS